MRLPEDVIIPQDKLLRYLLLLHEKDDKSKFLASAGYTQDNWKILDRDLRQFTQANEVFRIKNSPYGTKYEVRGTLTGPNGRALRVITIWIKLEGMEKTQFVTLFPNWEVA